MMREETFGPVLPIMTFKTEEEAVRLANDSDFGLTASVWTTTSPAANGSRTDRRRHGDGQRSALHPRHRANAWGGVKQSGFGRTHGGSDCWSW